VPETLILTLKVVMSLMLDETLNVKVALNELPGLNDAPSLFQLMVMGPFALSGIQLVAVMLSVNVTSHVFLT
jgi:hypothetical protein